MANYGEYKSYAVLGFESIPSEWHLKKIKYLFSIGRGRVISQEELVDDGLYPVFSSQTQNNGCLGFINTYDFDCDQLTWTTDGANAGTIFIRSGKHNCTNVCGTLQSRNGSVNLRYSYYSLQYATQFHKRPDTNGAKIMNNEMAEISIAEPSSFEQSKIVNFLDYETAKIDSLIEKQQKLIELLKEKRQAVISHAVTKGLNPDVPMKDSGNIWARQIPTHWKLTKLTYIAKVGNGATPARDNEKYWKDGTVGWLNSSKVNDVIITQADQFITPLAKSQTSVQVVQPNDLVMAITGEGQTRGRVAICQLDATINQHLASIRIVDKNLYHEFLFYWLTANYERIRYESTGAGSTKGAITCGDIGLFPVPVPPYAEQLEIVSQIKKQSLMFKQLMEKSESAIQLMQERRTALISSAVTGKIDVRHWQNPQQDLAV